MNRHFFLILSLALLIGLALGSISRADIVFNITPGAGGTANVEIEGIGTVFDAAGGVGFASETTSSLWPTLVVTGSLNPTPMLGGADLSSLTFLSDKVVANFVGGTYADGDSLSDLDGTYTTDLNFSVFVEGQFQFNTLNTAGFTGASDVGVITVNVAAVPEPSGGSLLMLGSAILAISRRKRDCAN